MVADPPPDTDGEPDDLAATRLLDWVIVAAVVLVLAALAVALWLSVRGGGEACAPVHQALGHC
jgi:hypothetical protein